VNNDAFAVEIYLVVMVVAKVISILISILDSRTLRPVNTPGSLSL